MTSRQPRIAVLASIGRNPVSGVARPNRDDLLALEIGRRSGGDVAVYHAGNPADPVLGDYLAYGADSIDVVPVSVGQDPVMALAERLVGFDLILAGSRSEGGEGSGVLPYLLAKRLGRPIVAQALAVTIGDGSAEITQFLPKGRRRCVRVKLPALVVVHPMAPVVPRYAHARKRAGTINSLPAARTIDPVSTAWRNEPAVKKPVKFKAAETKAGHSRMLSAIATESKGGTIVRNGTAAEKAQAILAYLREHRLIDF